jgi:hypothetical protein
MLKRTESLAPDTLVSLSGAGVRRGGRWLVRGVDLEVRAARS